VNVQPTASHHFVEVAVPLPLSGTLTYELPAEWRPIVQVGARVQVPVGRRSLTGVVLELHNRPPPAGTEARPVSEVVDSEPVLGTDLLDLARFVSEYYLAPPGEVLRAMLPPRLVSAAGRIVRLTDRGALTLARDDTQRFVLEHLLQFPTRTVAELVAAARSAGLDGGRLHVAVRSLAEEGKVRVEEATDSRRRLESAVEVQAGEAADLLDRCGRSEKGKAVVELLWALGRPASVRELATEVGCSPGVIQRLVQQGVLRRFTQYRPPSLDRHRLGGEASRPELNDDQRASVGAIERALVQCRYRAFVLEGVTGSGKTEVYLRALEGVLAAGRGAIVMVPEIALVPALAQALRLRLGERLAVLHSGMGESERAHHWQRLARGEALVAVGARSALFAPVRDLALVVVDEEHDPSYKQDRTPRYNARDLALVRAQRSNAIAILASATPSLEARQLVSSGRSARLSLPLRVGSSTLPEGVLVDLRRERFVHRPGEVHFSERLCEEIRGALAGGEQVILLRNRRGYAPILLCRACGEDMRCPECGLPRTLHRRPPGLLCHYCGDRIEIPRACPRCGEAALEAIGAGTERVEERFRALFPEVAVDVLDRDTTQRVGGAAAVLERFRTGTTRVLIGTQMVSKGHHFPQVSLAAVLSADSYLGFPDFRAVERTYSMLVQLAGRAGRGDRPGKVVIQTHYPDHYAVRAALRHDDAAFATEELRFRRAFHYPPFTRVALLVAQDRHRDRAEKRIEEIAARLAENPLSRGVRVGGPAPAPFERLRGKWRYQLVLRSQSGARLRRLLRELGLHEGRSDLVVDVDPQDLL
jgi:primosomal protein N' (replication factor Y) (superfamily II helicase)